MSTQLTAIISEAERTSVVADALAAYGFCMNAAGITVKDRSHAYEMALANFSRADLGVVAMQADRTWAEAVVFEKKAATADATCRRPAQDQAFAATAPCLQEFVSK